MNIIQDSPEHHFLTLLDKLKDRPAGWHGIHFALSKKLKHEALIKAPEALPANLQKLQEESKALLADIEDKINAYKNGTTYRFADGDIVILVKPANDAEKDSLYALFKEVSERLNNGICDYAQLKEQHYNYQKLADQKFLSTARIEAYEAMADEHRVSSIPVRRRRREESVVMIVEDDRFTASYAANILNKEYDLIHAKNGEEAITYYIDNAPDMVFMDIHLPGLNGHETLAAIKQVDPDAYVVMLSVDTVKSNIVSANERGASGFLKKPFTKDRLLFAVSKSPFIKKK